MIKIDKDLFEHFVPAAIEATGTIFAAVEDFLETSEHELQSRLIGGVPLSDDLLRIATRWVCMDAFEKAAPMLDLVATPTGFGVVNNQNVSPASTARVEALRNSLRLRRDHCYEELLNLLRSAAWAVTPQAHTNITAFIYLPSQLLRFGKSNTSQSLTDCQPAIIEQMNRIRCAVSDNQVDAMLDAIRADDRSNHSWGLVQTLLENSVGYATGSNHDEARRELSRAVNFMESKLEDFPLYRDSNAYQVKHFERYENKRNDPSYFFG